MGLNLPPGVELAERIGEGGLADVFRGTWNGRAVAFKVLREPERPGLRKRFLREGRLLQRLSHPSLVRCHAVLDAVQPMLVLDLLEGAALDRMIHEGPLPVEEGVRLAAALLRVLTYLHDQGIVHRDIKASNVWLCADRRVVLLDLGLAADVNDPLTTTLGDVLGTHAYMAPEQIAGAETDHRCDLYSLGITLYEALCGERPYHAAGPAAWLAAHRGAGAPPLVERVPGVPVRLASVVDRLMARDPAARPVSAALALAILTGTQGMRFELQPPGMTGREAAIGGIHAVLDGGGVLRILGEFGSGLGLVARRAVAIAREERVEFLIVRCRPRFGRDELVASLCSDLEGVVGFVPRDLPALVEALGVLCRQDSRVLVVVEDLDLAPPGVEAVLVALARIPELALVVLGRSLPEVPVGREIVLRPLTLPETRQLVARMLGTSAIPAGLDSELWRMSGGLPALIVGVLREQVARGGIWCEGRSEDGRPRWTWNTSTDLAPAEDVSRLFDRALRSLPDTSRRIVEVLAVAGEPVPLDCLLLAADADLSGLDLGPALRLGLVAVELSGGEEWVRLRRSALQAIFMRSLDAVRIQTIHLQVADAARSRPMREWEHRFVRLHLAKGARDPEDTADLVGLGDWFLASGRPAEALELLDAASNLPLEGVDGHAALALARGDALVQLGRLPEARAAVDAARALVREVQSLELRHRGSMSHLELALEVGSAPAVEARALVEGDRRSARARLLVGRLRLLEGSLDEARGAFEAAVALADPGPVDRIGVAARIALAELSALEGRPADAAASLRSLVGELRAAGRGLSAAAAMVRAAEALGANGRVAAALDLLRTCTELIEPHAAPWVLADAERVRAALHLGLGDAWGAVEILDGCAAAGEPAAPYLLRRAWLETLAEARLAIGDTPAALAAHLRALEAVSSPPDELHRAFHSGMVAVLTARPEPLTEAVEALAGLGVPGLLARLLRLGGVIGRDPEILASAEEEARRAGDQLLLLDILHARRLPRLRAEARALYERLSEGLFGPLATRFAEAPASRWAAGERGRSRHDTGG